MTKPLLRRASLLSQCGLTFSLATIKRSGQILGLTFHETQYCQLICEKEKHLVWATKCLDERDTFDDVILSDETSVQLKFHRKYCLRKANQPPKLHHSTF